VLRFFRMLMPREEKFFDKFVAHSGRMVAAADELAALMAEGADAKARLEALSAIEKQADVITQETIVALHRAFITPFDRGDIHALIVALDDTVDLIEEVGQRAALYRVEQFSPRMRELGAMIQSMARLLAEVTPMLTNISGNAQGINVLCERISNVETDADRVLREAISELVTEQPPAIVFFGRKEVYELLEAVTDRCDDVADVIQGILLEHV
jgi:uncharacterized protein